MRGPLAWEQPESDQTVFYYNPWGGKYFHSVPDCELIHEKYHNKMKQATEADLTQTPFPI
jgi:hypothetical protein